MVTAPQLEERLDVVLDQQPAVIIIDLSDVEFLASAGMNALVMVHRRITGDQRLAVVADGPATSRPLRLIGLAEMINMCPTLDEAYQKVGVETAR
jgi:anti-anti-sigma factor